MGPIIWPCSLSFLRLWSATVPLPTATHLKRRENESDNTLGLGNDVPIAMSNGNEFMIAVVDGKLINLHVPYPMGFFTKNADGRIDDANAGWKGRGLWTTSGTRTVFHNEGGKDNSPKVYKMQVRPDPLAH